MLPRRPADVLAEHPLPDHGESTSKHDRGAVLIVGGSTETAGAIVLAGLAALRVGAGQLQLASVQSAQAGLSVAVPEARVIGLGQTDSGAIDPTDLRPLLAAVEAADALVIGPGSLDADASGRLRDAVIEVAGDTAVVLDAGALPTHDQPLGPHRLLIPNPAEMERLLGPFDDPEAAVIEARDRFGATVALRGPDTWIAAPGHDVHVDHSGHPGLATSGSGDVLAGAIGGLLARGADPLTATLWAVAVHGFAGHRLAERIAPLGFLARELLDELAPAMVALGAY
jgi:hydroxyethylthiazole kinase-like uncharacterized protein yjeF